MSKVSPKFIIVILLALFFGASLYLRVYFPYNQVFSGDWIKLTGIDAYFQMRLVDNFVHNFPHFISFDPYFIYPGGHAVNSINFFNRLLAGIIWVIGLGSPTQHTVDVVGVYFPAVLGALIVIPVYFIGKELFGRWAGIISAGLIVMLPGEFLGRSILGFTDYHIAESLFTAVTVLFLILAIKAAGQGQLTFSHLKRRDWAASTKPIIYSLLAGIFLGVYLITWQGGMLFVFIISVYLIVQFIIDHLKRKSTDYLCLVGFIFLFVALMIYLSVSPQIVYLTAMVIALFVPPVLYGISWLMASKEIKPAYYPLALVGLGLVGLAVLRIANPSLLSSMLSAFRIFYPAGVSLTTMEMQPLLFPRGEFTFALAWGNFRTTFFLSFVSLIILIYLFIKQGSAEKGLLLVWCLIILAATLGQRRFAYYFAVNVALLTGYLSWRILELAGFKETTDKAVKLPAQVEKGKAKLKRTYKGGFHITIRHINMALAVIVIFFLVFFPIIKPALATAKQARFAPSDAWYSSLSWLKENTPDPFNKPGFYYELYETPPLGERYDYPESAYSVAAWWDYGYWITRIAHRIPSANPSQDRVATARVAHFFSAQDEDSANKVIKEMGSLYVVIDSATAIQKFWAIALWSGKKETEFFEVYRLPREGKLVPVQLFYPEYYRSLSTRLYNFDGKAVAVRSSLVVSYQEKVSGGGETYKHITEIKPFPSYEEATAYISSQKSANHRIVGANPFFSPVPLEALEDYKLVYSSAGQVKHPEIGKLPEVKIFEYIGD